MPVPQAEPWTPLLPDTRSPGRLQYSFVRRLADGPGLAHAATKRMIRLAVDEGVEAADAAMAEVGARVMASRDLQNGARTLLEKGPGQATFQGR
jgi:enoyl-CoA hydratase/carnithine racemase